MKKQYIILIVSLFIFSLTLFSCGSEDTVTPDIPIQTSRSDPIETSSTLEPVKPVESETKETETSSPETETTETAPPETQKPVVPDIPETVEKAPNAKAQALVDLAKSLIGTTFKLGGVGPDQFDNSGFVYYVCKENGITIPRLAAGMNTAGTTLARKDMLPGDIAVFCNDIGGPPAFVGIYIGDGKFIACNNPDSPTHVQNMDSNYWTPRFISGRRVADP